MKYTKLGRTGLKVSTLCLGTMTFGNQEWGSDEATAKQIVDAFIDAGGNFIDTADVYVDGVSEEITGRLIKDKRKDVILATKVAGPMGTTLNDLGLSRKHILDSVDASLKRLGTDYIDLYQVHAYDPTTPLDETLIALNDCVRSGKVRYIGCSNYSAWQIMKATGLAKELGVARYDCLQPQYSLVCRYIEREHVPLCIEEGIGIIPWSPLGGGMLTGKIRRGEAPPQGSRAASGQNARFTEEKNLDIAEALIKVAADIGKTPSQVALSWCMNQPGVTSPIFGARTMAQLEDNVAAADIELEDDAVKALEETSGLELVYPYDFHQMVRGMMDGRLS
ncbi:MAG TPA: aldo/keto reductase [Pseudomonadales bacterium]|nr:aldo/keto reductase [Pseudomonadales bacterium]